MENSKQNFIDLFKGVCGGIFIAVGALSAIGFTEDAANCVSAIILLIIGAFVGIIMETLKVNRIIMYIVAVIAFSLVFISPIDYVSYSAAGIVLYMGCALALPEKDVLTNAITGASAAVGFIIAVIAIL